MQTEDSQLKKGIFSETNIKLLTAIIALTVLVVGLRTQYPTFYRISATIGALLLLMPLWSWLSPKIKKRAELLHDRKYIASELPRLKQFYARLSPFISSNDSRSLRSILQNAPSYRIETDDRILGSEFITSWIHCYSNHLEMMPRSLLEFTKMGYEFTTIVTEFNRNYVIRTQQHLSTIAVPPQAEPWIQQLEKFRQEFTPYLREIEQWAHSVNEVAAKRMPELIRFVPSAPIQIFERVNAFKPKDFVQQK